MTIRGTRAALSAFGLLLLATSGLPGQIPEPDALATATADALEPGVRAALGDGRPISFEHRSPWGAAVKSELEEALGSSLTAEHRSGASRILLGAPRLEGDTAVIEVWFGRCEANPHTDAEVLRIRMYSFTFRHGERGWNLLRPSRLGTTDGSCDGEFSDPGAVQA